MLFPNDAQPSRKPSRLCQAARASLAAGRRLGARLRRPASPTSPAKVPSATSEAAPPLAGDARSTPLSGEQEAWARRLGEEKTALLSLVASVEKEFLAIGEGFERMPGQLSAIQRECQSLLDLTQNQGPEAAVQFAFQLLKKAEDLMAASYEQYDYVFAAFRALQARLAQLPRQHQDLLRSLAPFNFITNAFRLEASRHPAKVERAFSTLADTVAEMVNDFRAALEAQFRELDAGERIVRSLMRQVSASVEQHRAKAAVTLEASRSHLRALNEALAASGNGASDLAHLSETAHRHIGSMVMAQQCQDITRQKIEHVVEAMNEMGAHLEEESPATAAARAAARRFIFHASQIQSRQVRSVFDELNGAAESFRSGIQNLRAEATAAAEVAVKVGACALDSKVAGQCQASIGEILAVVVQAVQTMNDILVAFGPLQARFTNCTTQATELGRDVRRATLNAQLFAVHAPSGATLEVLAKQLGLVSDDAIEQVERLGNDHQRTAEMVNNLRQRLDDFQQLGRVEQEILTQEFAVSRQKLADVESAVPPRIRGITQQQAKFARSVEQTLAHVRFPDLVAAASARSLGFLGDLVDWSGDGEADLVGARGAALSIDRLQSHYTMASERATHSLAMPTAPAPAGGVALPSAVGQPQEAKNFRGMPVADSALAAQPARRVEPEPPDGPSFSGIPKPSTRITPAMPVSLQGLGENVELF